MRELCTHGALSSLARLPAAARASVIPTFCLMLSRPSPAEGSVDVLGVDYFLRGAVFIVPEPLERGGVMEVGGEIDVDGGVENG